MQHMHFQLFRTTQSNSIPMLNVHEYQASIELGSSTSKKVRIGEEEVRLHRNPKWYVYKPNKSTDPIPASTSMMMQFSFPNNNNSPAKGNELSWNNSRKKYGTNTATNMSASVLNAHEAKSPVQQLTTTRASSKQKKAATTTDTPSEKFLPKIAKKKHQMELKRKEANLQRIAIRNLISNS